jgi:proteasome lid subunit RPN8/RPN11
LTADRTVRIRAAALEAIAAHARSEYPRECCGLLIGLGTVVIEAVSCENAADDPLRRFEIPPAAHIQQLRRCRELTAATGERHDVIGAYHSHPRSAPVPSERDLAEAFSEFVYLITGPTAEAGELDACAYLLEAGRFVALRIERC